jgi:glycosyltransferase involved in cell wall biosynthesis
LQHAPVAIDGRAAVRAEIGGVERYAREMARRLPELRPDRYRVITPPKPLAHRAGHAWEQAVLPLKQRSGLLYCPATLAPVAVKRTVVVIHDAASLRHPEAYSRAYVAYHRLMLPAIAQRARLVITVSEFSRDELAELLGVPAERITVIGEGVDERFTPEADPEPARRKLDLEKPYVLAVGTVSARKNLGALEPVGRALDQLGIELVLAGSDRAYLRGEAPVAGARRLGYVPEELLPGLYAGARALVMPSLHEGFGLPCLEAMAAGVPVVASRSGALPETCGGAALLVDPSDPAELTVAAVAAVTDERIRARLVKDGLRNAAVRPWSHTAELTDAAIEPLLNGG